MSYIMNDIVAFFSRCLLYTVFVVVSKVENTHVEFSMFERVVLTCLQICVLCAAWVAYEFCAFIIRSVSKPASYEHVLEDAKEKTEQREDLLAKLRQAMVLQTEQTDRALRRRRS